MVDRPRPVEDPAVDRPQPVEEERTGLVDPLSEGDVGGALQGLGQMLVPRAGTPGNRGLDAVLRDFVEFSRIGDIGDIAAAVDPNSGLDPLERVVAASPFIGVGAVGARTAYKRYANRRTQSLGSIETAQTMAQPPGDPYDFDTGYEALGGPEAAGDPRQSRKQAARFEQLSLEAQSPFSQATLRAESWEELSAGVLGPGWNTPGNAESMSSTLQGVGAAVIELANDPTLYGADPDTQVFVAAKVAVTKWNRAADLGIIDSEVADPSRRTVGEVLLSENAVDNAVRIAQFEAATSGILGPNLQMPSPGRLGQVWVEDSGVRMAYGIVDGLLPVDRLMDWDTQYPFDPDGVRTRQQQLDFEAVEGVAAVNIAKAFIQRPEGHVDPGTWYRSFNRTAMALAEDTPYTAEQAAGVISALSANTPWIPTNLVGAVHVILQTGRPDLVPGSPEYIDAFRRATTDAGWGWDMFDDSSAERRGEFEQMEGAPGGIPDFEGLMESYATATDEYQMTEDTKKSKVDMILKANLPPWLALRGMKTNTFSQLGADPDLVDLVTIDTWNDRLFWGSFWVDRPLAHEGYSPRKKIDPETTYHDPISGDSIPGSEILERVDSLAEEHGWSKKQVERWTSTLASFPSKLGQARFLAQARAHLLVRDELGLESGHQVQAGSWAYGRAHWDMLERKITEGQSRDDLRRVASEGHLTTDMFSHFEGNPSMERTAAGMLWEVDDTLSGQLPLVSELKAVGQGVQRPASGPVKSSIIAVRTADGRITPYADASTPGVAETLRHATPSGLRVGSYERYISKQPRQVLSVQDHFASVTEYRGEDGRLAAGRTTLVPPDPEGAPHPGTVAGDRIVVLVPKEQASSVEAALLEEYPFTNRAVEARTQATATARNKIAESDLTDLDDGQVAKLLEGSDWVAITAHKGGQAHGVNWDAQRRLKIDVERAGGQVVEAEGRHRSADFQDVQTTNADLERVATEYMRNAGMEPARVTAERTGFDYSEASARADAFEGAPTYDTSPEVRESYEAFKQETLAQYQALVDAGYTFEWVDDYIEVGPDTVHARVRDEKHLPVFSDRPGFDTEAEFREMKEQHPIFEDSPVRQGGRAISFNELFRAVHDVFGHSKHEYDFTALGEENAWRAHAAMYSDQARSAMTFETRAQNSWQNFGPHLRDAEGAPLYGTDQIDPDRPFPPQKAGRLPVEMSQVEGPNVSEPTFFITGLSYADALRLAKKYGQEAVATRHGMLNTDGSYFPTQGEVTVGDAVDQGAHTKVAGHRFSLEYDQSQAQPIPEDVDSIADVTPEAEAMTQMTIDLGGDYGGPNWNVTDRLLGRLGQTPGARIRLYTHSRNRVPAGYSKAVESVVTDAAGVTGSTLHRGGDQYARHQSDVWVPDWEHLTLSEDGFGGERTRRGTLEARSIMEIDQEAGMVWFDKDLAIQVDPASDVTMDESGAVFRSLRVDGSLVRELVVDTNGPVPLLVVGQEAIPAPGRTVVELSRGAVTRIRPHSGSDWAPAKDALASAGLIPDGEGVTVQMPEVAGEVDFEPTAEIKFAEDDASVFKQSRPTLETDVATTERVRETVTFMPKVILGQNAHPDLHRQVVETLENLHRGGGRFPGTDVVGPIPTRIWRDSFGIDTTHITDEPNIDALTAMEPEFKGIILNERHVASRWNHSAQPPETKRSDVYSSDTHTDFEVTLVHEVGHLVAANVTNRFRLHRLVQDAVDRMGGTIGVSVGLSRYARRSNTEFIAEAFAKVMIEGDRAHPALIQLTQELIRNAT